MGDAGVVVLVLVLIFFFVPVGSWAFDWWMDGLAQLIKELRGGTGK